MVGMHRNDLGLMMEAGYMLVGMQRFREAREVFEGIAVMAPESEFPIVALGSVDFCQGRFREACRQYKKALKMHPEGTFAKAYLGEALFFLGKTSEALRQLQEAVKDDVGGKAGAFAGALMEAIQKGFTPNMLSGVDDLKQYETQQQTKGKAHVR